MIAALYIGMFIMSILAHELGHMLAFRACGTPVTDISVGFGPKLLWRTDRHGTKWALRTIPLGGYVAVPDSEQLNAIQRGIAAFAGPAVTLLLAGLAFTTYTFVQFEPLLWLGYFNAVLGVTNLIPLPPLDGGRMLLSWLEVKHGKPYCSRLSGPLTLAGLSAILALSALPFFVHYRIVPPHRVTHITAGYCTAYECIVTTKEVLHD